MGKNSISPEHKHHHPFAAPEELAKRFDAPERNAWQKPEQVMDHFGLVPGATVAEIGSGTGYFAVRIAERVPQGKVICLDDEPKMVEYLLERCESLGLKNVEVRPAMRQGVINLFEEIELLFSVDVYHHIRDRVAFFAALAPKLKPEGRLAIIDRHENSAKPGVVRIAPATVVQEMQDAGYSLVESLDFLPHQYFLNFKRQ